MSALPLDARAARFGAIGSGLALTGVAAGAFGAHALRDRLAAPMLAAFETAARYQMIHALALLAVAWLVDRSGQRLAGVAGWWFVAGTLLFSGSLYALALSGVRLLGAITPLGGLALMAGWLCLAIALGRSAR